MKFRLSPWIGTVVLYVYPDSAPGTSIDTHRNDFGPARVDSEAYSLDISLSCSNFYFLYTAYS